MSVQRKAWTMTSETNDAEEVSRWSEAVAAAIARCVSTDRGGGVVKVFVQSIERV